MMDASGRSVNTEGCGRRKAFFVPLRSFALQLDYISICNVVLADKERSREREFSTVVTCNRVTCEGGNWGKKSYFFIFVDIVS